MSGPPGPSQRYLDGATPGLLDPSQPSRVLRLPGSKLSFASFDPRAASAAAPEIDKLSLNGELYRPKRIVIETLPNGRNYWRFVPRARWGEGVRDEGEWPREISICGETLRCTLDQWDIYKLDPAYDCFVPAAPAIPIITRKETLGPSGASQSSVSSSSSSSAAPQSKRRVSSPPTEIDDSTVPHAKRRKHDVIYVHSDTEDEEEDEVEEMMVDRSGRRGRAGTKTHVPSRRTRGGS
ncbi:hypothetical protein EWM64_g3023 [Hericium alpestre]|uniref:Uncharacterized protein n=1 Tax=Hericium alpestre TaxID=135208 RepID=A0A4Z0A3G3_9AGAM|nr:hypothetical protein EWM64_g3023 [Hericium alpestre]